MLVYKGQRPRSLHSVNCWNREYFQSHWSTNWHSNWKFENQNKYHIKCWLQRHLMRTSKKKMLKRCGASFNIALWSLFTTKISPVEVISDAVPLTRIVGLAHLFLLFVTVDVGLANCTSSISLSTQHSANPDCLHIPSLRWGQQTYLKTDQKCCVPHESGPRKVRGWSERVGVPFETRHKIRARPTQHITISETSCIDRQDVNMVRRWARTMCQDEESFSGGIRIFERYWWGQHLFLPLRYWDDSPNVAKSLPLCDALSWGPHPLSFQIGCELRDQTLFRFVTWGCTNPCRALWPGHKHDSQEQIPEHVETSNGFQAWNVGKHVVRKPSDQHRGRTPTPHSERSNAGSRHVGRKLDPEFSQICFRWTQRSWWSLWQWLRRRQR